MNVREEVTIMRLTIAQAAEQLQVNAGTVRNYVRENRLPHYRVGPKLLFIDDKDIEKFISDSRISPLDSNEKRGNLI